MKKFILTPLIICLSISAFCQQVTGNWEGNLSVQGKDIPVVFHISTDSSGKTGASFDSPSQFAYNLACDEVIIKADSITLMMKVLEGKYTGRISGDGKQITGTFYQGGFSLPLHISKTSDVAKAREFKRPQTPIPPFPYRVEDVEYDNADKSVHFGGTLTLPAAETGKGNTQTPGYPAVLLVTGSGKQDRDESIMEHKPFAVIADYLTRRGIAVLRTDDRDMGKTTGNFEKSTTADFAKDAEAGIDYLKTRKEIDPGHIGLIGHSEGGMIAPMVAVERPDVKFIILLAGPGVKIIDLMQRQSIDVAESAGVAPGELENFGPLYHNLVTTILAEKDSAESYKKAQAIFREWQSRNTAETVKNTTGVSDEKSLQRFIRGMIKELSSTWFNYFIRFNPEDYLSRVKCPVLALNGEKDIQVSSKPNLEAIRKALKKAGNKNFRTAEIAGANHLFQHCKKCTVEEYQDLEETIAPEALDMVGNWIKTILK